MNEAWYPSLDYLKKLFKILKKQYPDLRNVNDMDDFKIKGILDRLKYGLPYRELSFMEKIARYIYDMSNLHPLSDGNKRLAYFSTEIILSKNGYHIIANDDEKVDFMEKISTTNDDYEYKDKIQLIEKWFEQHCKSSD
ncbi:MAG: type II toxin-antitoxin system death-on-curing family toxin [Promethearchaeota archaeon]